MTDAYVAGLIDGEGCLYLEKAGLLPRLDIGMSDKALPLLKSLKAKYGGSLQQSRKATEKWAAAWCWALTGRPCAKLLQSVGPHIVLKQPQVQIINRLLELRATLETRKDGRVIWTTTAKREAMTLRALLMEANRKGPSETVQDNWFARLVGTQWLSPQQDLFSHLPLARFSETWPRAGTMRSGIAFQRPPLAPLTAVTDSGLWPTPTAGDSKASGSAGYSTASGRHSGTTLADAAVRGGPSTQRTYPTPTAQDAKNRQNPSQAKRHSPPLTHVVEKGALNPTWVEWLMGYPEGWTDLKDSETPSSPKWSNGSGGE